MFELLVQHQSKIKNLIVGIHFYQTDPDFIEQFLSDKNVKFVMHPNGVFHPKMYLFEFDNGDWTCVCGSSNFTQGGLASNVEACVQFSNSDEGINLNQIMQLLEGFAEHGKQLDANELDVYRKAWQRQKPKLRSIGAQYDDSKAKKFSRSPLEAEIFNMSWTDFYHMVKNEDAEQNMQGRLQVVEGAAKLFQSVDHFSQLDKRGRRSIAGMNEQDDIPWAWFGRMSGLGVFQQAINDDYQLLSDALDEIPLTGTVSETHFNRFVKIFERSFSRTGIGTATRLLTMKRPDYFCCVNLKSAGKICSEFNLSNNVTLESYWQKIVEPILDSEWWTSRQPSDHQERRVWNVRTAFLDARYCEKL
ncbi:phospholipase D family protein [Mariniblastus sp.]|nr:phospholipase D family protein [Mariniblastus sp.]